MRFVNVGENQDIWIFDRDQGTLERLTEEGSQNAVPVWTPEGARIAFASVRDGEPPQLYWQPADGSGSAERLLATDFRTMPGSWSPDGQTLAFVGERNGSWDVGLLTLGDSTPRWILETEFNELQPQLSPDGLWLAYTSGRSGEQEVYVEAASGEGRRAPGVDRRSPLPALGARRRRPLLRDRGRRPGRHHHRGHGLNGRGLPRNVARRAIRGERSEQLERARTGPERELRRAPRGRGVRAHQARGCRGTDSHLDPQLARDRPGDDERTVTTSDAVSRINTALEGQGVMS